MIALAFSAVPGTKTMDVRDYRKSLGVIPSFKRVDTCAAEFQADTPYMYSTYDGNDECDPTTERKVGESNTCVFSCLHNNVNLEGNDTLYQSMPDSSQPYSCGNLNL